jgi:hypothetical protein
MSRLPRFSPRLEAGDGAGRLPEPGLPAFRRSDRGRASVYPRPGPGAAPFGVAWRYLELVRMAHTPKRNFMKLLEGAKWG